MALSPICSRVFAVFEAQMRRVLPEARFVRLDRTHRIFDAFFTLNDIDAIVHPMSRIRASYDGIFEENDAQGLFPFDASNEACKLGVNYLV